MRHHSRSKLPPFFTLLAALLLAGTAFSQKNNTAKADKLYQQLGYHEAIRRYREGSLSLEAMERMAHSFRLTGDSWNAQRWYAQIVGESSDPLIFLYYAQALHTNGHLEAAREFYLKYDQATGHGNDQRGQRLAAAIERQRGLRQGTAAQAWPELAANSEKLDFSPAFFQNGVVFVSNREPKGNARLKDAWTGDDFTALYFAEMDSSGRLGAARIFDETRWTRFHEGPATFSRSSDLMFFTNNQPKKGQGGRNLTISTAVRSGQGWGVPEILDLGGPDGNDAHPSLSPQGLHLYFSSDRPGGFGGMDIYVSQFLDGKWGSPVNLGPGVNTPGNELFPFIHDDGTLFFASDGWGGLGGLDIFYTIIIGEKNGAAPVNPGAPFNSPKDDFGIILNLSGTEGYFTSSREGGTGKDDLYGFSLPQPLTSLPAAGRRSLTISVLSAETGEPLPGVRVSVLEKLEEGGYFGYDGDFALYLPDSLGAVSRKKRDPFDRADGEAETYTTGEEGTLRIVPDPAKNYLIILLSDGYEEVRQAFTLSGPLSEGDVLELRIPAAGSGCLGLSGQVVNRRDGGPVPGASATLVNLSTGEVASAKSDQEGRYVFPCVPCGCDFIVQGLKEDFKQDNNFVSTADLDCKGGRENIRRDLLLIPAPPGRTARHETWERPIGGQDGERLSPDQIFADGITIELDNIYYDFNQSDIRPDAAAELDKVVALLRRHPDFLVEIRSFTDARGDAGYNQRLSSDRAQAAMFYIVNSGINPSRITSRGFGETWPVNECEEGVPCTEAAHQMNRRTEIKVFLKKK